MANEAKKHITSTWFSKLIAGLMLGSSLVLTIGCGKFSSRCLGEDQQNPKSLSYFSYLSILDCINLIKPRDNPLILHKFFRNISAYKEKLSNLHNLVPLYITENAYITFLDHFINSDKKSLHLLDGCGYIPLHWAVQKLNLQEVYMMKLLNRLMAAMDDVSATDQSGRTALYLASEQNLLLAAKTLVEDIRTDPNKQTGYGTAPLHVASRLGHWKIVQILLTAPTIDVNIQNGFNATPLHLASKYGHVKVVEVLSKNPRVKLNETDKSGKTAIEWARIKKHREIVEILEARVNRKRKLKKNCSHSNKKKKRIEG